MYVNQSISLFLENGEVWHLINDLTVVELQNLLLKIVSHLVLVRLHPAERVSRIAEV